MKVCLNRKGKPSLTSNSKYSNDNFYRKRKINPSPLSIKKGSEIILNLFYIKIKSYSAAGAGASEIKSASASAETFSPSSLDFSLSAFL